MSSKLLYRFPSSPATSPPNSGEYLPIRDFHSSTDTVHRTYTRKASDASNDLSSPTPHGPFSKRNENLITTRQVPESTLRYHPGSTNISWPNHITKPRTQHPNVHDETPLTPQAPSTPSTGEIDSLIDIDLNAGCGEDSPGDGSSAGDMSGGFRPRLSFDPAIEDTLETRKAQAISNVDGEHQSSSTVTPITSRYPFRRWMRSLRYRSPSKSPARTNSLTVRQERWSLDDFDDKPAADPPSSHNRKQSGHKKTSSWSSSGLVTAVKSATVGLAASQSPKGKRLSLLRNRQRSSGTSQATVRGSTDSQVSPRIMDDAAWERARQRRRAIEELVDSEESYVADLKVLDNVRLLVQYSTRAESDQPRRST